MDINYLRDFAAHPDHPFNTTGPLSHKEVVFLAKKWIPQIRFHEDEYFHTLSLGRFLEISRQSFNYPENWLTYKEEGSITPFLSEPPLVYRDHDSLIWCETFEDKEIDFDSYFTNLKRERDYEIAKDKFGSEQRHSTGGFRLPKYEPVMVVAEFRMLREALKQNLWAQINYPDTLKEDEDEDGRVMDAVRSDFLFGNKKEDYEKLIDLIETVERPRSYRDVKRKLNELKDIISEDEWVAINRYGFLTYHFIYAYNDYGEHEGFWFNNHEGDVEGCCLVFERSSIDHLREPDRIAELDRKIEPSYILTSGHNEWQQADQIRKLSNYYPASEQDLMVWVARASHATFLSGAGEYHYDPLTNWWEDSPGTLIGTGIAWCLATAALGPLPCLGFVLAAAAMRHFHPKDETSNDGAHAGSPGGTGQDGNSQNITGDPNFLPVEVRTTPLSLERNIYSNYPDPSEGDDTATLAERAFPGFWGNDDDVAPSPQWSNKTMRYFRKLIDYEQDE